MEIAKADIVLNIKSDLAKLEKEIGQVTKEITKVEKAFGRMDKKVSTPFEKLGNYFTKFISKLGGVGNFLRGLADSSDKLIGNIGDKLESKLGDKLVAKLGGVGNFLRGLANSSDGFISNVAGKLRDKLGEFGNFLKGLTNSSSGFIGKLGGMGGVINSIGSAFTKVLGPVGNFFNTTKAHYQDKMAKANEALKKEMMLLQMQTEAEKEYQNFKKEQEAEEFERKYGIREEEYLQMDERAQKEFEEKQIKADQEELLNLKAVRSREEKDKKIEELEKKKAQKEKEIKSKQFKADKASNIASALISTAKGIVDIWAKNATTGFGVPIAAALTALLSTKAGIEIGAIAAQKNPYAYKSGGIALSDQFARLGEAGPEIVLPSGLSSTLLALNQHYQKLPLGESREAVAKAVTSYDNRTFNINVVEPPDVEDFVRQVQDELGRGVL